MTTHRTLAILLAGGLALSPRIGLASGNTLTLTSPTWDTSTPAPVSTAALSGGYGVTAPGACYQTPDAVGQFPQTPFRYPALYSAEKSIWFKMPTSLPSTPQLIYGDTDLSIAENTSGQLVFGSGPAFLTSTPEYNLQGQMIRPGYFNDGLWHRVVVIIGSPGYGYNYGQLYAWIDANNIAFGPMTLAQPIYTVNSTPGTSTQYPTETVTGPSVVTGIRGNPTMNTTSGTPVASFAGEVDEAMCGVPAPDGPAFLDSPSVPATNASPYALPTSPIANATQGALGLWHLSSNGTDSATWVAAAGMPVPYTPASPPPNPNITSPTGGFPIE